MTFCTILTEKYIPYALALFDSIVEFDNSISLQVLVADKRVNTSEYTQNNPQIQFHSTDEVCTGGYGLKIKNKYQQNDINCFRWAMKPVFVKYLLQNMDFKKVIFVDADIQFYADFHFLFDKLESKSFLITPHWRNSNPRLDTYSFQLLYTSGLYNAGFFGANNDAYDILDWWAAACEYKCVIDTTIGQFMDQTHLNLIPVYFNNVEVIKHQGCNVAAWNIHECKRTVVNNEVLINNKYPIVFIHLAGSTTTEIKYGNDYVLQAYLDTWIKRLKKYGVELKINEPTPKNKNTGALKKILAKMHLGKRIKAFAKA